MDLKKFIINMHLSARNPNRKNAHKGGSGLLISSEYSYAIETGQPHYVSDIPSLTQIATKKIKKQKKYVKGTTRQLVGINQSVINVEKSKHNTQSKSMKNISTTKTSETSRKLTKENYPILTLFVGDSPASLFPSLESAEDSKIREELFSSILPELSKLNDLALYSLRTLKDSSPTTKEELLTPSSSRLMNWGMTYNGKCLTARISVSPRIGKECSLSDILEEHVDPKYFLSEKAVESINQRIK
ncbi:hypothetical protein LCGC14_1875490, partial [marine sediment metagenome]